MRKRVAGESISQAEIDALFTTGGEAPTWPPADLARLERLLAEFLERGCGVGPLLLGQPLAPGKLALRPVSRADLAAALPVQPVAVDLTFVQGGQGNLILALPESLTLALVGCLMGDPPPALDGPARGALAEVVGQLAAAGLNATAERAPGVALAFGPPAVGESGAVPALSGDLLLGGFTVALGEAPPVAGALLVPGATARSLLTLTQPPPARAAPATAGRPAAPPAASAVRAASLPELSPGAPGPGGRNIDLILDVTLQVTVELGRTKKQIREVLALGPGSLLELDKLAGEAVDVLVNGKLIARGEVVVIDENFGVRITDIVSPAERAVTLR